ncbi:adenylate/guanylate cyclase domain-containing protein [Jejuia spongiicola]|uniref:Adenylate/guanylate cyclase domain-containing protein n=1 Tax=Jejuia spongiicola TaxID=2942207 RepID=A0ABT0QCV8_9FLAO|nr:adenylate/guanylate cyclase domain-containing protein [Jejuia spongiicola]MCL6294785.1 adenylate/guanylate cyclase domain-containing protein [Jejuia spongiicola]
MRLKKFIISLLQSIIFWTLAFFLFIFLKYNGLEKELEVYTDETLYLPVSEFYQFALILGFTIGIFYAIIEFLFDKFFREKLVLGVNIIIKSLIYFILIIIVLSVFSVFIEEQIDIDLPNDRGWWHNDPFFWNTILYFIVSSIIFSLIKISNDKFGPGVFLNMLLGKYKKPKEEERILMFVDLKDSTKIAEHLGHEAYSRFIQDCFSDLNSVLRAYEADIYQYVGDEAVISWNTKKGFRKNNCVNLFFAFLDKLNSRQKYYLQRYNYEPKFKAGLHCGKLMIAEVGTIKKELAYHGDVINTASRIQGLCNKFNSELLVSQPLLDRSLIALKYKALLIGDTELKGREEKLKIYSVTREIT